jgi:putative nucleotidyltransferase with HDIG domain
VLAYSAGLYHDIGKVLRPEYFVENQRGGQNRHDKLLPSMSALILLNHVKDGLELAREHSLPQVIRDAIQQHHGTRLIKYFYHRAIERKESEAGEVLEEKYRYPGPKPQTKVLGVMMLADAIEAASRTLTEPTPARIRGLIQTIVDDVLQDGQLEETELTLSDLRKVSDTFLRVLANIFHQRIDYPGFDFNAGAKREKRTAAGEILETVDPDATIVDEDTAARAS